LLRDPFIGGVAGHCKVNDTARFQFDDNEDKQSAEEQIVCLKKDGLLTNDKFCFIREGRLTLRNPRVPRHRRERWQQQRTLLKKQEQSGVDNAKPTAVGNPANLQPSQRRPTTLGSGVSVSPEMVSSDERKGDN
jgi:hypothetical protein